MRIPFIAKVPVIDDLGIEPARFKYISDSRGGSAFLLAGALFWLFGALFCWLVPSARTEWVIYGGLSVPVVGTVIATLQRARLWGNPIYASLAAMATLTELAVLPVMIDLQDTNPEALPGILLIAVGAHLFVLMWLHLDYSYFLSGCVKIALGIAFMSGSLFADSYPLQMLLGGLVSLATAILVWRDSRRTLQLYLR